MIAGHLPVAHDNGVSEKELESMSVTHFRTERDTLSSRNKVGLVSKLSTSLEQAVNNL